MRDLTPSPRRRRNRLQRVVGLLAGTLLVPSVWAGTAHAHAFLVDSSPRPGERLDTSPPFIRLRFTEPIVAASGEITLSRADGTEVEIGSSRVLGGGLQLGSALPSLERGAYVVSWRARSAVDGHVELGEFAFAVGAGARLPSVTVRISRGTDRLGAAAAWLALAGLMLALGGLASERWVWRPVAERSRVVIPAAPVRISAALGLMGAGLQLVLFLRQQGAPSWGGSLVTPAGLTLLLELVGAAQALVLARPGGPRALAMAPLGLALAAAVTRGHAASPGVWWWALPANLVHVGAASLWAGGLVHLVRVAWGFRSSDPGDALGEGARRYASFALLMVAAVLTTGIVVTASQLSSVSDLIDTRYGRVLLVKLGLVVSALGLALAARRRALGGEDAHASLLRRLTAPEAALVVAAIAAAAALANTTPPRAGRISLQLGPPPLEGKVVRLADLAGSPLAVHLAAADGRLQLRVIEPSREPAADASIEIEGRAPDGTALGISPRPCGPGCVTTRFAWEEGETELVVAVSSPAWGSGSVRFSVLWPPGRDASSLLRRVVRVMRSQPEFELTERVWSGLGPTGPSTATITGRRFVAQELYAAGGAVDVRLLGSPPGRTRIVLFLPGSWIWYRLELDAHDRIRRERIVSPGHRIDRSFSYPDRSLARPATTGGSISEFGP